MAGRIALPKGWSRVDQLEDERFNVTEDEQSEVGMLW